MHRTREMYEKLQVIESG